MPDKSDKQREVAAPPAPPQQDDKLADIASVQRRYEDHRTWLKENAPECFNEQKHVQEGTQERIYWHYGYMVALRDILRLLGATERNIGKDSHRANGDAGDDLSASSYGAPPAKSAGQAAPPLRDHNVLFEIADGPEGITLYTSEEEAVVDWAHDVPALYCTVSLDGAHSKFGPFRLSKNLITQLKQRAAAERPAQPLRQVVLPSEVMPSEVAKKILTAPPIADVNGWAETLAHDSVRAGEIETQGADSGVEEARRWLVAFINAQRAKGDDNLTWQDIEDDALLYGFSIPELLTQHTADLRRQRDALQAEQERAVRLAPLIEKVRKAGNRLAWNEDDELFIRNVRAEAAEHSLAQANTLMNEIQQAAMKVEEERANPYAFVAWANVKLSAAVRSALAPPLVWCECALAPEVAAMRVNLVSADCPCLVCERCGKKPKPSGQAAPPLLDENTCITCGQPKDAEIHKMKFVAEGGHVSITRRRPNVILDDSNDDYAAAERPADDPPRQKTVVDVKPRKPGEAGVLLRHAPKLVMDYEQSIDPDEDVDERKSDRSGDSDQLRSCTCSHEIGEHAGKDGRCEGAFRNEGGIILKYCACRKYEARQPIRINPLSPSEAGADSGVEEAEKWLHETRDWDAGGRGYIRKSDNRLEYLPDTLAAYTAELRRQLANVRTLLAAEEKLHEQETNERVEAEHSLAQAREALRLAEAKLANLNPDGIGSSYMDGPK